MDPTGWHRMRHERAMESGRQLHAGRDCQVPVAAHFEGEAPDELVFTAADTAGWIGSTDVMGAPHMVPCASRLLGLEPLRVHDMRHTALALCAACASQAGWRDGNWG